MKKTLIILICILTAALVLLLTVVAVMDKDNGSTKPTNPPSTTAPNNTNKPTQTDPTESTGVTTGWVENSDGTRSYLDENGSPLIGWQTIEEKQYCFDANGIMQTGWVDGHYLLSDGAMAVGAAETDMGIYYFDADGNQCTGWIEAEDGTYYMLDDGHPYTGWLMTDTARLYFTEFGKMATGFLDVDGVERYFTSDGNYVPLVNPWNEVPEDYVLNLVEVEGEKADYTCAGVLAKMLIDCREAGFRCPLDSGYRSIETQQYLWNARYNNYIKEGYSAEEAKALTWQKVAYPGTSEHHTGLAVDIIGTDEMYAWLYEHSWEYGFIVRYPADKIEITGIMYEPWHFRYVGKEMAKAVFDSGLTLEEYLESIRDSADTE